MAQGRGYSILKTAMARSLLFPLHSQICDLSRPG